MRRLTLCIRDPKLTTSGTLQRSQAGHGAKPSVVQIRAEDVSPEALGNSLTIALRQMATELEAGALLTVDPSRTRLNLLPLQV